MFKDQTNKTFKRRVAFLCPFLKYTIINIGCLYSWHKPPSTSVLCSFGHENRVKQPFLCVFNSSEKMTKRNELNTGMNNSSALVAPTWSEIRIEIPSISITLPSRKKVLNKISSVAKRVVHPAALSSTTLLCGMSLLEVPAPFFVIILLAIVCVISETASFLLIYKEVIEK